MKKIDLGKVPSTFKENMLNGGYQKKRFVFTNRLPEIPRNFMVLPKKPKKDKNKFDEILTNALSQLKTNVVISPKKTRYTPKSTSKTNSIRKTRSNRSKSNTRSK
jgi:hypothetical protein